MNKNIVSAFVALGFLSVATLSNAQVISIQFNRNNNALPADVTAGFVPEANWNVNTGDVSVSTPTLLNDSTGAVTTAGLALNYGGYFTGNNFPNTDPGDQKLLGSGLNSAGAGSGNAIHLTNIPYALYDVYVYASSDNGNTSNAVTFSLTPANGSTQYLSLSPDNSLASWVQSTNTFAGGPGESNPAIIPSGVPNANYVEFTGLSANNFDLQFAGLQSNGGWFNASLNGIQIVQQTVPEPATFVTAGLGLVGLVAFRRRRS